MSDNTIKFYLGNQNSSKMILISRFQDMKMIRQILQ
jgi:hypothetical protein